MKPYVPNKYSPVMGGAGRDEEDRSSTRAEEDDDEEPEWTRIEITIREPFLVVIGIRRKKTGSGEISHFVQRRDAYNGA